MFIKDAKRLPIKDLDNCYVVADFDRTITASGSRTSWSILSTSEGIPEEYARERQEYYDKYRPIEVDETLDYDYRMAMMTEWFQSHINLFVKYGLKETTFQNASSLGSMEFRPGAKEFLEFLKEKNVPVIIISAGIGNFIEMFLREHQCYFDNIYVCSNQVLFENGLAVGVGKNIIHSFNKNEVALPKEVAEKVKGREDVILLGDQVSDLNMVNRDKHSSVLTVGFWTDDVDMNVMRENFDVVCDEHENYDELRKTIFQDKIKMMKEADFWER